LNRYFHHDGDTYCNLFARKRIDEADRCVSVLRDGISTRVECSTRQTM